MSAGNFISSRYEDDNLRIYRCRIQPETLDLVLNGANNNAPPGAVNQGVRARMSGSRKAYGVRARSVRIRFTAAPPSGYSADDVLEVPVMTLVAYNDMTADPEAVGTYLGAAVRLVGFSGESRR